MRPRLRQSTRRTTCVAVVAWALAVPGGSWAVAAGADAGITAAGIQLGGHVAGPMLTPASLAHRVVLLEFWGVNCPPCIRSMPLLEEADGLRDSDPVRAADLVQRCSMCFKGTAIGSDAAALLREWRKDKAFQAALRAGQQLVQLEAVQAAAAQAGGLPPALVGKVRSLVTAIRQTAPDSRAADQAATIAGELGVTVAGP
jgi:hypothetical protein